MKKSVKETLKSVIVLFTIALVCVGLLAVANNFLKYEAKLDKAMAKTLYDLSVSTQIWEILPKILTVSVFGVTI